jgi:hypothetical protein
MKRERVSYETKLTSGNEADHNQGAMREVKVKTATERDKNPVRGGCEDNSLDAKRIELYEGPFDCRGKGDFSIATRRIIHRSVENPVVLVFPFSPLNRYPGF